MGVALGIAAGATMLGSLISGAGQAQQGQQQAAIAERNAQLAEAQATDAQQRGGREAGLLRMRASRLTGAQKAAYANSGVDVSSGSPLEAMADTRMMSELDVLTARNNAARQAWGYRVEAQNYREQARADRTAGTFGAIGSLLGGGAKVAGMLG